MSGYPPPVGFNLNQDPLYPPAGGLGYPPPGGPMGGPPAGPGYGSGFGAPGQMAPGYGGPPGPGYGAPGQMAPGYGGPPGPGYGAPGQMAPGYGGPPGPGYGAPGQMAPGYGGPQGPGYGAPQGIPAVQAGVASAASFSPSSTSKYYAGRPTVVPFPKFDAGSDANELRKAMRGIGTNEAKIIEILSKRTAKQRLMISEKYIASFGKNLHKDLKSELSGKFEDVVLQSIMDLPTMLATSLYKATKGAGTNEWALIQILVPYSNAIVKATVEAYRAVTNRNLESDLRGDTSGDFEKILVSLMQGCRDESDTVNMAQAQTEAEELYNAGEKRMGTEEAVFTRILTQSSFAQIKAIAACYLQKYGKTLEKAIKKETSGYYEKVMVSIVRFAENKNELLAEWFYDSMVGLGTRDDMLIRLVLGRCEIDLQDIKDAYMMKYKKPLVNAIQGDTSGDYKKMLIALVNP